MCIELRYSKLCTIYLRVQDAGSQTEKSRNRGQAESAQSSSERGEEIRDESEDARQHDADSAEDNREVKTDWREEWAEKGSEDGELLEEVLNRAESGEKSLDSVGNVLRNFVAWSAELRELERERLTGINVDILQLTLGLVPAESQILLSLLQGSVDRLCREAVRYKLPGATRSTAP